MDPATPAQRDILAIEHDLGIAEMQRTPKTFKEWVLYFVVIMAGCYLCWMITVLFSGGSLIESFPQPLTIEVTIFGIFVFVLFLTPGIIHTFTHYTVYIYTNGLVYLKRTRSEVARWEEIVKVDIQSYDSAVKPENLAVCLVDGTRISFLPIYASRSSASLSTLNTCISKKIPPANPAY